MGDGSATISTDGVTHLDVDGSSGFTTSEVQFRLESRYELDVIKPNAITKVTFATI